jgi:hypothetical protein
MLMRILMPLFAVPLFGLLLTVGSGDFSWQLTVRSEVPRLRCSTTRRRERDG